jgi:hypothetical protein
MRKPWDIKALCREMCVDGYRQMWESSGSFPTPKGISMKPIRCLIIAICTLPVFSQQSKSPAPKLSDNYGKAAFLALKAIERDTSQRGLDATAEAIASADAEASSEEEKAMTKILSHISIDRTINNGQRELLLMKYMNEVKYSGRDPKSLSDDPKLKAIDEREWKCFRSLEDVLRSRSTIAPESCSSTLEPKAESNAPK